MSLKVIAVASGVLGRQVPRRAGYSVIVVALSVVVGLSGWLWRLRSEGQTSLEAQVRPEPGGTLLICGGGKLPDELRRRFYDRAGGQESRIVVIPGIYVGDDEELSQAFLEPWKRLGARSVQIVSAESPKVANTAAFVRAVAGATGVWLGGGDQEWLSATYAGTQIEREIKGVLNRGGVVGGSSAGAAVMSPLMIAGGRGNAVEASGLGLLPDTVIDQHLLRRNRLNRLLGVVSAHPDVIGFGVDERTGLEVCLRNNHLSVIGDSYVVACLPGANDRQARVEILKRGDETNLVALRDSDLAISSRQDIDEFLSAAAE
ncbi:MAG TPA: cyanophycinase [Pirellulales bacterium]|nr:cyanophycinase [Pirellulales bacterium]